MSIIDNFILPGNANEAIAKKGMNMQDLGDGISRFVSGHDKGVAYTFFTHAEYNQAKSKISGYDVCDEEDMIMWHKSKYQKPTEKVKFLPSNLLGFDEDGNCVSGKYKEDYLRFKEGKGAIGLSLDKWSTGELSTADIAVLAKNTIFTVEQLAEIPEERIRSKFAPDMIEIHRRALEYVKGKDMRAINNEQASKMLELEQVNKKLMDRLDALENNKGKKKQDRKSSNDELNSILDKVQKENKK